MVIAAGDKRKRVPRADTVYVYSIKSYATLTPIPAAAQERNVVTASRESAKNLVQVQLGTTAVRILAIVPVYDKKPH